MLLLFQRHRHSLKPLGQQNHVSSALPGVQAEANTSKLRERDKLRYQ